MGMQGVAALNSFRPLITNNNLYNSKANVSDFKNLLNGVEQKVGKTNTFISAKQSLQETYPDLKYHVLDSSQFTYWNRLDFPDSKIFEDHIDAEALKTWKPTTQTATGYEPWVQRDLEKIQKGLHVVFIHPATQEKMDKDPEYAKWIADKIEKYFENDIKINKAIDPKSVEQMSQAVSITEDGQIGLHVTVCDGPSAQPSAEKEASAIRGREQEPLRQLYEMPIRVSLGKATAAPLQYDYRYAYSIIPTTQITRS
ncbi:hypothetical protein H70357_10800 [Paenibacillus sp. FSL H7-0357]|uniref:hypothetical protein n=1 Tax=Paenibacillus sp. FSL H7-0357 TaxID=1536774 RepID=UPI0004F6311D|nr:hypothetical protein [Paenibacillus sp. FSL H7-0357]AIQ17092.1 hypothetical protein H70357_10800 [Paenibacillus sp. FSL H7-0357]